ncbi:MAG: metalloregulator ArsR/SmtB family transcription factor [Candidatus Obscuribacterales bacterium]|nr:metalloregulator ArsR/SmtB family transcription factor [Candidatus Obscuribacterales bacterium]
MMKAKKQLLTRPALEIVAARFRALSDASRLQILQTLFAGEHSVQDLCELTAMSQANVSKHLSVLAEQGIVQKRRQGLFVYYSIADDTIYEMCDIVCGAVGKRYGQVMKEFAGR